MGSLEDRLDRLEAGQSGSYEIPPEVERYFKVLAGEPLTPEEEREMHSNPKLRRYFEELEEQREEQRRKERSSNGTKGPDYR